MLGNPLVRFWEGQGGNLKEVPCLLDPSRKRREATEAAHGGRSPRKPCAEHVQQLGSESLLPNLMEVKG